MKQTNNERLLKLIAEVAEQAYRRGFQHGTSWVVKSNPSDAELMEIGSWRLFESLETARSPTEKFETSALERLEAERPDIAREIEGCAE